MEKSKLINYLFGIDKKFYKEAKTFIKNTGNSRLSMRKIEQIQFTDFLFKNTCNLIDTISAGYSVYKGEPVYLFGAALSEGLRYFVNQKNAFERKVFEGFKKSTTKNNP